MCSCDMDGINKRTLKCIDHSHCSLLSKEEENIVNQSETEKEPKESVPLPSFIEFELASQQLHEPVVLGGACEDEVNSCK